MRGGTHSIDCGGMKWNLWIPYQSQLGKQSEYLYVLTNGLGKIVADVEVITHHDLHERLLKNVYNVSIRDGDEIRRILTRAREVAVLMLQMYKEAHGHGS